MDKKQAFYYNYIRGKQNLHKVKIESNSLVEGVIMFLKWSFKNYLNNILRNKISKNTTLRKKTYIKIRHLQQAGFTLIELMITVTLTSFIALAISSVFIFSVEQFHILMQQHKTEEAMLFASYHMRSYLSQAVNTQRVTTTPSCHLKQADITGPANTDRGFIVEYDYDNQDPTTTCSSSIPPETALVALFPRENSFKYNSVDLFETSIFYERPTAPTATDSSRPGRLMFGLGTRTSGSTTSFLHSPHSPHNIIYTGLSHFELKDIVVKDAQNICPPTGPCGGRPMIRTAQVLLRFRYFLFIEGSGGNFYDYTSEIREVNAREIENTIDINFHNNTMAKCSGGDMGMGCNATDHPTGKERIFGPIYFYKLVIPAGLLNF